MLVSDILLLAFGRGKFEAIANQLPADASILTVHHDKTKNLIEVVIESETFPLVDNLNNLETVTAPIINRIE